MTFRKSFNQPTVEVTRWKRHYCGSRTISWKRWIIRQKVTVLIMLDLSSAFDTINHKVLLKRLSVRFGISDGALKSYLSNSQQYVSIDGQPSKRVPLAHKSLRALSWVLHYSLCTYLLKGILSEIMGCMQMTAKYTSHFQQIAKFTHRNLWPGYKVVFCKHPEGLLQQKR